MTSRFRRALLPILLAALPGCELLRVTGGADEAAIADDPAIVTDSTVYHLRADGRYRRVTIGFVFTNLARAPVQVPTCHGAYPPFLQKREGGAWVDAWIPVVMLCLGPPLVIRAGETYHGSLEVAGGIPASSYPRFLVDPIPGTYRLVWGVATVGRSGELPLDQRVSAPFEIVV
jgi:hypothetical protein